VSVLLAKVRIEEFSDMGVSRSDFGDIREQIAAMRLTLSNLKLRWHSRLEQFVVHSHCIREI
jgi:hypothetical protein